MKEPKCLRCGQCCYYMWEGVLTKCKHLKKLSHDKTHCMIYETHLGTVIAQDKEKELTIVCGPRIEKKEKYKGCPYNELI